MSPLVRVRPTRTIEAMVALMLVIAALALGLSGWMAMNELAPRAHAAPVPSLTEDP